MRAIIQRVSQSSVAVNDQMVGSIGLGIMALIGLGKNDSATIFDPMLDKILSMRIFPNEQGRFDKSLADVGGELLLIPQFTLFADTSKGRRPEFFDALSPQLARPLFEQFVARAKEKLPQKVASGLFGADMKVSLINDGPFTISIEI